MTNEQTEMYPKLIATREITGLEELCCSSHCLVEKYSFKNPPYISLAFHNVFLITERYLIFKRSIVV